MNAMTILKRCRAAREEIQRLEQRIAQRRELLDGMGSLRADPNGGSRPTGDPDRIGRILGDIDQLEREMEDRKEAEMAEKVASVKLADMLPDLEGKILYCYYVKRMDTPQIARKEKYTAGYVRKTKRSAEQLLGILSPERVKELLPAWYLREKGGEDE